MGHKSMNASLREYRAGILEEKNKRIKELEALVNKRDVWLYKLRKALEFYADEQTYTGEINSVDEGIVIPIDIDRGKRATEALKDVR